MTYYILSVFIQCNAPCVLFQETQANCSSAHCGCHDPFLQAEANCLLCQATAPEDEVSVQILFDGMFGRGRRKYESESLIIVCVTAEIAQCQKEKVPVDFHLDLTPEAEVLVQKFYRQSESTCGSSGMPCITQHLCNIW